MKSSEEKYYVGSSFKKALFLSEDEIISQAISCGDHNFIHSDKKNAEKTRFGSIIASGSAISSIFSAMIPTHFQKIKNILGLEMNFKFQAPIYADVAYIMQWTIDEININSDKLDEIISLTGEIYDESGSVQVSGGAKILLLTDL